MQRTISLSQKYNFSPFQNIFQTINTFELPRPSMRGEGKHRNNWASATDRLFRTKVRIERIAVTPTLRSGKFILNKLPIDISKDSRAMAYPRLLRRGTEEG